MSDDTSRRMIRTALCAALIIQSGACREAEPAAPSTADVSGTETAPTAPARAPADGENACRRVIACVNGVEIRAVSQSGTVGDPARWIRVDRADVDDDSLLRFAEGALLKYSSTAFADAPVSLLLAASVRYGRDKSGSPVLGRSPAEVLVTVGRRGQPARAFDVERDIHWALAHAWIDAHDADAEAAFREVFEVSLDGGVRTRGRGINDLHELGFINDRAASSAHADLAETAASLLTDGQRTNRIRTKSGRLERKLEVAEVLMRKWRIIGADCDLSRVKPDFVTWPDRFK